MHAINHAYACINIHACLPCVHNSAHACLLGIHLQQGVTHHAGGRVLSTGRFTNSNVTGLTHVDYLALPAKARVALVYEGEEDAEAFMGLKKL
jgi:hypothetical protein